MKSSNIGLPVPRLFLKRQLNESTLAKTSQVQLSDFLKFLHICAQSSFENLSRGPASFHLHMFPRLFLMQTFPLSKCLATLWIPLSASTSSSALLPARMVSKPPNQAVFAENGSSKVMELVSRCAMNFSTRPSLQANLVTSRQSCRRWLRKMQLSFKFQINCFISLNTGYQSSFLSLWLCPSL